MLAVCRNHSGFRCADNVHLYVHGLCFGAECRNLLHQILEPNPEVRIPLSEIEIHPWLTRNGKYLFTPYVPPPRDKQLRHVVGSVCVTLLNLMLYMSFKRNLYVW